MDKYLKIVGKILMANGITLMSMAIWKSVMQESTMMVLIQSILTENTITLIPMVQWKIMVGSICVLELGAMQSHLVNL